MKRGPYKGREQEYDEARRLRAEERRGLLWISKRLGVSVATVRRWTEGIDVDPSEALALWMGEREPGEGKEALRARLLRRQHECSSCGTSEWCGVPVPIELHRLDPAKGYVKDNVELLCCNCHALTESWRGRGKAAA